jgi:UDP-GlcNAc3NAcA epimerase
MKKIIAIIGARPQFIKHYPFEKAAKGKIELITIHTGQHYDENMSAIFFDQLGMEHPMYILDNGGGNHGSQTGKMMIDIEAIVLNERPDCVVVYGDTNSTLAGALVAAKLHVPVYHIEAGLRSYNRSMPEEINRVLTDHISQKLFVTSEVGIQNLRGEGIDDRKIFLVGDIMKDLVQELSQGGYLKPVSIETPYYYATIHRPYNTDDPKRLNIIFERLNASQHKVVVALHPRTQKLSQNYGLDLVGFENLVFMGPQSYFDNLSLLYHSCGLITDSGGMQKEAYWLQKKCVTIRTETEWIETVELGGNVLLYDDLSGLEAALASQPSLWKHNLYGSGNAARQIIEEIVKEK